MKSSKLTTNFTITDQLCIKLPQGPPLGGRLGGEVIKKTNFCFIMSFVASVFQGQDQLFTNLL